MTITETSPEEFLELCAETWGEVSLEFCSGVKKAILGESIAGAGLTPEVVDGWETFHMFRMEWDVTPQKFIDRWNEMQEKFL